MGQNQLFYFVKYDSDATPEREQLLNRPSATFKNSFQEDAALFVPGERLELAINTAIAVGEPLLLTGEPGTGKTQAAYYTAYKLGIEPVLHFQVKSDSSANDLLYFFDTVRYFHDATVRSRANPPDSKPLNKSDYVEKRVLWNAFVSPLPRVVLIDEIDKAPRDFPNDLLHELDKMEFVVAETGEEVAATKDRRPIVFITSNGERQLPEPFLRRCVYHHIDFSESLVRLAVRKRLREYSNLSEDFIDLAVRRYMALRDLPLRKRPSMSELFVWLRVLSLTAGQKSAGLEMNNLNVSLPQLPHINVLIKDRQDYEELG